MVRLENVVWDARDPHRLGAFWAAALGAEQLTDEPDLFEARVHLDGGFLDVCFPRVESPSSSPPRLHLDLAGGAAQGDVVERLLELGAQRAGIGQGDVPWVVLTDPEGGAFCVMGEREVSAGTGPIASLPLDSADPQRDAAFWAHNTGWTSAPGVAGVRSLRHPSGSGPLLELCPEPEPKRKGSKNRVHLDVRREVDDGDAADVVARLRELGASLLTSPGELPWLVFADPSGNEFCVLAPSED